MQTARGKLFTAILFFAPVMVGILIGVVLAYFEITRPGTAMLIGVAVGAVEFVAMRFVFQRTGLLR